MNKQMKIQFANNYAGGGIVYSKWLKDEFFQTEFNDWMEDGNVSKNADGTYSTQDAQYQNRLKGMSGLKKYFYNEFIKGQYEYGGGVEEYSSETINKKRSEMNISINTKTGRVYVGGIKPKNKLYGDDKGYYLIEGFDKFMNQKYPIKKYFSPIENVVLSNYMNDTFKDGGSIDFNKQIDDEVEYEIKTIVNEAKNQKKNTHFAIHKPTNSVVFTWDYSEYDTKELNDSKEDYFYYDVKDIVSGNVDKYVKSDFVIVQRKDLEKRGIDLNNYLVFVGQKYDSLVSNDKSNGDKAGFDNEETSMVLYHEEKGNFMIPKGQIYLWIYEGEKIVEKLQGEEYDYVFYPYASISLAFQKGFVPPLKKIWTKKFQKDHKGSEHLLGIIKAYLIDKEDGKKELFIDMMSVNPTKKKKGIMSYMIKELRDIFNLTQDQVTFSKLTDEGEKFIDKKTYADGGWLLINADTERIINEYKTESEARQMMYEYDGDSFVIEKSELEKEKLRETYREPAPLNPATYIMKDGGRTMQTRAKKQAILDIKSNLWRPQAPYQSVEKPSEEWERYQLPYDTKLQYDFEPDSFSVQGKRYSDYAKGGLVLASSSTKEGINKLIEQYLYGSTITLVQTDNDKIYEVHNKKGKTSFYVEFSRGKYKFIQPSMYDKGGSADGGVGEFPPKGELTNKDNFLLKYEKTGSEYEFFVYKPITKEVSGYNQIKHVCLNKDCPQKMTYDQFINYLYAELYLDDNNYAKGGKTISQTPAPKKDQIKGSSVNKEGSAKDLKSASKLKFSDDVIETLKTKVEEHNAKYPKKKITLDSAKAVLSRGMGAFSTSYRPTIGGGKKNSRVAWGLARLNAFIYKIINGTSKSGKYSQDNDLIEELGYKVKKFDDGGELENDNVFDATKLDLDKPIRSRVYFKGVENEINKVLQNNYKPVYDFDKNGIKWVYKNTLYVVKDEDLILELKEALASRNRNVVDTMRINNQLPRIESRYGKDVNFAKKMHQEAKDFYQNKLRNEKSERANDIFIDYLILRLKENKIDKYEKGGAIYPDLSLQKAEVVNDSVELTEFQIRKIKNTFKINGLENTKISSSRDAVNILRELFSEDTINAYEQAFVLYLNKNNKVIGYYHHSMGSVDGTIMDVQMISGMALKSLSKGVIIAHNHPSDNTNPSDADKRVTATLKDALKLFNILLLDSIILTDTSFTSFADEGLI